MSADILNALAGTPETTTVVVPRHFLRAAGADNNPYGRWWFEANVLLDIQQQFERIPIPQRHKREAILGRIRAATPVFVDWNSLAEFWIMALPLGHSLNALVGPANEQPVFSVANTLHNPKLLLKGGIKQYYFAALNPLWVYRFGSYLDL